MNRIAYEWDEDDAPQTIGHVVDKSIHKTYCGPGTPPARKYFKARAHRRSRRKWKRLLATGIEPRNFGKVYFSDRDIS